MKPRKQSLLEFALLGLVQQRQPCSGYDLRKIFTTTPMGSFSDSPGAIYPALHRLERAGLVRGRVEDRGAVRRRKLYRLSPTGDSVLKKWLHKPVERHDVVRGMQELTLRFAFMEGVLGRDGCIRFLESFVAELTAYTPTLYEHLKPLRGKGALSARLALEFGIKGYEYRLAWARKALAAFRKA